MNWGGSLNCSSLGQIDYMELTCEVTANSNSCMCIAKINGEGGLNCSSLGQTDYMELTCAVRKYKQLRVHSESQWERYSQLLFHRLYRM